ncbi:E3 ubiquitin-protein ligase RNF135 isoform X1 [Trichechus manatus latirostris]|uniref:E3 ubiquitin-protein ligase RNF135 n=1 Tax=Trichechus manatus latirostris TaxID=127582 RepID=A0A2Y9RTZ8_TRIMA|nr:E3 ubiquitin-protein ligase RNF135 isoform X1 [Trichechus manatus latirostris]
MAGFDSGPAIPVWLNEDDLGCIICRGLLNSPVTLPCGHSFCSSCLKNLWDAWREKPRWACPTCRECAPQKPPLRKNTMLQDLADKYSRAVRELEAGRSAAPRPAPDPARRPAQLPAAAQRSIPEVGRELAELVEQLVDITRNLQSQRPLSQSEADNELSNLGMAFSHGVDLSLASPKLVTSNTSEGKTRDVLLALEEIQEKLRENFMWKEAVEKQTREELLETPSTSSCPLPDQNHSVPKKTSRFAQRAISPTFDLRSLSCSLEVSEDHRTVTVSHWPQSYPWSHERFKACQVLCSQAFSSGQQYWEVDTQHCSHWAVGVASWEMSRDQILGRTRDSWCVEWTGTSRLSAWHMAKELVLSSDRPGVVGIWLDLEAKKLAFYAVANQEKFLYECEVSASYPLHPAFWLYGLHPGNSLIINSQETK